ncbi:MAG: hypothetical protein D6782_03035, partial [Alphaproteobacteria bacterium]
MSDIRWQADAEAAFLDLVDTGYCRVGGLVDERRLERLVRLHDRLWDIALGDLEAFVRDHPPWRYYRPKKAPALGFYIVQDGTLYALFTVMREQGEDAAFLVMLDAGLWRVTSRWI